MSASKIRRIYREWQEISELPTPRLWSAHPVDRDSPYEWHFTLKGPEGTAYEEGIYHGRIVLPPEYPLKPPSIYFMTLNGRFETGKPICLSVTDYHPEEWQAAWGVRTILDALQSFLPSPAENAANSLDWSDSTRRQLARVSRHFICPRCGKSNKELLEQGHPRINDNVELEEQAVVQRARTEAERLQEEREKRTVASDPAKRPYEEVAMLYSLVLLVRVFAKYIYRDSLQLVSECTEYLRTRMSQRPVKTILCILCCAIFAPSAAVLLRFVVESSRSTWFLHHFPIRRPGQDTPLSQSFDLTYAERTNDFQIHPWIRALLLH